MSTMNTYKTSFYHLQDIAKIRNCLSQDNAETLVHAFISSELDFCNALVYDLPQLVIDRLRYVQNCADQFFVDYTDYQPDNELRTKYYFLRTKYYFLRTKY